MGVKPSKMLQLKILNRHPMIFWLKYSRKFRYMSKTDKLYAEHIKFYKAMKFIYGICNLNAKIKGRKD